MDYETIGARLRMERFKRNLTQTQVCEAIKIKVSTLSRIENNRGSREKTIKKLINFYEINDKKAPLE